MKYMIYIAGILGGLLIILRILGAFVPFFDREIFLLTGVGLILLICVPLFLIDGIKQNKKVEKIIKTGNYKKLKNIPHGKSGMKGWSMNNSPFRERKSGLTWGGGNIHAANAKRGKRRGFMR